MAITVHAPGILLLWWAMWTSPKLCWISGTATAMPSTARAGHLWVWHFRPVIRTNSGRLGCKCVVFPVTCCIQISKISRLNRSIQRHSYPLYPLSVRITATKATKSMKLTYAYICLHHPFWISSSFFSVSLDLSELFQHFEVSISSEFGNRVFHNFTHWTHIGLNGVSILRIDFASIWHQNPSIDAIDAIYALPTPREDYTQRGREQIVSLLREHRATEATTYAARSRTGAV